GTGLSDGLQTAWMPISPVFWPLPPQAATSQNRVLTCADTFGAPGRNRTYDTRFRKPVLYPLSYEGGACVKRGRKPVAELRSSFGTSILAVGAGRSAVPGAPRVSWFLFGLAQDVLRPLRAAGRLAAQ